MKYFDLSPLAGQPESGKKENLNLLGPIGLKVKKDEIGIKHKDANKAVIVDSRHVSARFWPIPAIEAGCFFEREKVIVGRVN